MVKTPAPRASRSHQSPQGYTKGDAAGTALANYSLADSYAFVSPISGNGRQWGGARNRADRVSEGLSDSAAKSIIETAQFAMATGRIFQRHWIVHYGKAGIAECDGAAFVGRLLNLVSKQARRDGGELAALWVREWASSKGGHVHILLFLPVNTVWIHRTRRWIVAAGGTYRAGVSKVRSIGGQLAGEAVSGDPISARHYRENGENVVRYLLKAAGPEKAAELGLVRFSETGPIIGKRWGSTNNLGPAARKRWQVAKTEWL